MGRGHTTTIRDLLRRQRTGTRRPPGPAPDGPIRVLWVVKGLGVGGAEQLLAATAAVRDRDSFHYEAAYLLPWKDALAGTLEAEGVAVHCLDARSEWDLRWLVRLRRLVREGAFDVVHVHSPYVAGVGRVAVRAAGRRVRLVSTEHNVWWSYVWPTRLVNALTAPLDAARIAVSQEVRRSIPRPFRRGVEVVVHGIRLEATDFGTEDRRAMRAALGLADDEVAVLTVGNFRPGKGHMDLLEAARDILDRGLPVRFLVAGHGPLEDQIRERHRALGLGDRVVLLGFRDDALRVAAACDMFVLSSLHEGFPVAVMEALAVGLPVVATAVGGVPDVVHDGVEGFVVPPGRPDLLADAIERVVADDHLRAAMSDAATARRGDFDIRRAARTIEETYRTVVGR